MDPFLAALAGGVGGLIGFGCAWFVKPRRKDVDDLALDVERIARIVNRYKMQRVREATGAVAEDPEEILAAAAAAPNAADPLSAKAQLRRRLLS